ncbi:hypothetical protein CIB84_006479 [Bambusicola thoracicus]|uniref:Protein Wnt n=1 Tax=Bambusicola thoracicus TaxID=9083 RepID=A0A2P4T091_BAMTH|nr:hypothetical protein CIB84_006479 [Bambusicola thoracicus]
MDSFMSIHGVIVKFFLSNEKSIVQSTTLKGSKTAFLKRFVNSGQGSGSMGKVHFPVLACARNASLASNYSSWFVDNICGNQKSLALGQQYSSLGSQPILCGSIPGLVPKQLRFCRNYIEIMPSVAEGVKLGIQECQHQFRGRRWNCTTIDDSLAIFGPVLDKDPPTRHSGNLCKKAGNPSTLGITLRKVRCWVYLKH